jgi:uncharacterized protein
LLQTELRVVILDPNSDFVRVPETRDDADRRSVARWHALASTIAVRSATSNGDARLRLRFGELEAPAQGALLRLDPIADREEHAELAALLATKRPETLAVVTDVDSSQARRLGLRVENLAGAACHRRGAQRLPGRPGRRATALATERAVRIAGEGRKFGIYLLVASERPPKVHENVPSQCDNLVLMRLNSAADAAFIREHYGFAPPGLVDLSTDSQLGEALVAGKIVSHPAVTRFGRRITREGGADVDASRSTATKDAGAQARDVRAHARDPGALGVAPGRPLSRLAPPCKPTGARNKKPLHLLDFLACAEEDSNLHPVIPDQALNLARLPIPPSAREARV